MFPITYIKSALQRLLLMVSINRRNDTASKSFVRVCVYLFECEGLVLLKGLLRQRAELSDLLHALLFLLEQHTLPVGHLLQLLGVVVDGIILLLLNVLPTVHALYVVLDLHLGLVNQSIQIWVKHWRRR